MNLRAAGALILAIAISAPLLPYTVRAEIERAQIIRFLGVTIVPAIEVRLPEGAVGELIVGWEQRPDHHGIVVSFLTGRGAFSPDTEIAILCAIDRAAHAAQLQTDSWTVSFAVADPAGTIYGDSVSALAGLAVVALAKGDFIPLDRTMTGTITPNGMIGPVTAVPLKIQAAHLKQLSRVVIPDTFDATDADWFTPFMMQISPIHTAATAYQALTDHPFFSPVSVLPAPQLDGRLEY
jgi:hypothetical protein